MERNRTANGRGAQREAPKRTRNESQGRPLHPTYHPDRPEEIQRRTGEGQRFGRKQKTKQQQILEEYTRKRKVEPTNLKKRKPRAASAGDNRTQDDPFLDREFIPEVVATNQRIVWFRKKEQKDRLNQKELNKIPVKVYQGLREQLECPICCEGIVRGQRSRALRCQHQMHQHCLDAWLKEKASCPICRCPVLV